MGRPVSERIGSQDELYRVLKDNITNSMRTAIPGIIQKFDPVTQTAEVQIAIREKVRKIDLTEEWVNLPLLLDVPIVIPRAGAFVLTMPIKPGDECLIIFADMCIDAWWSNGGIQNQIERRRHDLSDAFAIPGTWSQPNKLVNYSVTSTQLRNEAGTTYVEVKENEINLVAATIKINGHNFAEHTHDDADTGTVMTGGVS